MELEEGDYVVGVIVVDKDALILSISENGYGKRTPLQDYRLTARGRKALAAEAETWNRQVSAISRIMEA